MRSPAFNQSLLLAFGASLALHAAVLVGSRLVPRAPTLASRADQSPQILVLTSLPVEEPVIVENAEASPPPPEPPPPPSPAAQPEPEPVKQPAPEPLWKPLLVHPPEEAMTRQEPKVFAEVTTASRNVVSPETAPPIVHLEVSSLGPSSVSEDSRASPEAATTDGPSTVTVRTKPRYRYNPEPTYPPMARRRHQEGMVLLNVLVTSEGGAAEVRVVKSSGYTLLDEAARNAVRRWTFEPGRLGRIPVSSEIQVPIQFKLVGQ